MTAPLTTTEVGALADEFPRWGVTNYEALCCPYRPDICDRHRGEEGFTRCEPCLMRDRLAENGAFQRLLESHEALRTIAVFLWDRLDDIDTAGDIASRVRTKKGRAEAYERLVMAAQARRFEVGETDGYSPPTFKDPQA